MASSSTARALILSLKPLHAPPPSLYSPRHLFVFPTTTSATVLSSRSRPTPSSVSSSVFCCFVSGIDGGGVSDTRRSEFSREFAVIANMLKQIEPLDTSDISQGVSDSAKDSMKQTISTMLGLLPSDQFDVSVRVSKLPLHRLLASSIITGYTLWNAEYRISLMRNLELSFDRDESSISLEEGGEYKTSSVESEIQDNKLHLDDRVQGLEQNSYDVLKGLTQEGLNYVERLEAELNNKKKELDAQRQEYRQTESNRPNGNNLLEYLRSLQSEMVSELSRPSSLEVKEVIHQLVENTLQRFFKDIPSELMEDRMTGNMEDHQNGVGEDGQTISTSRDYLAKLLFWCMLLGHHLRGLENRLHLSCAVGLL
ncbi:hypothetical protein Dimus_033919 [Dionaea muscipula]